MGGVALCRGFVLVGGKSSRMGRDKALMALSGRPMVLHVADSVARAVDSVSLVGSRERYGSVGLPVIEDLIPGRGPLSGIHAALKESKAPLNLVVGCDMPFLSYPFLRRLLGVALVSDAQVIVPESPEFGLEPLCAIYNKDVLPAAEEALQGTEWKLSRVYERVRVRRLAVGEWQRYDAHGLLFKNVNTPEEFERAGRQLEGMARSAV